MAVVTAVSPEVDVHCDDHAMSVAEVPLVTGADVEAAAALLEGVVRHTPLHHSRGLADRVGGPVWLKCENLQRTGSFKIRGAYTRISRLTDEERARGVVAASAGNHAQGVALAARLLGAKATVFMPETAPLPKVAATRAYGAEIRMLGQSLTEPLVAAAEYAEATGLGLHPPVRPPRRHRRAGHGRPRGARPVPRRRDRRRLHRRRGTGLRDRRRGEGPPSRREGRRRAGGGGRGVPRLAGRRPPGRAAEPWPRWPTGSPSPAPAT